MYTGTNRHNPQKKTVVDPNTFPNAFFLSSIQYTVYCRCQMPNFPLLCLNGSKLNYGANRILQSGKDLNKINDGTVIIMVTGTVGTQPSFYYLQSETNFASHFSQYMLKIYCKLAKSDGLISQFLLSYETQGARESTYACCI
jgi:hypothetical protein